jgi:hypothetical protein
LESYQTAGGLISGQLPHPLKVSPGFELNGTPVRIWIAGTHPDPTLPWYIFFKVPAGP